MVAKRDHLGMMLGAVVCAGVAAIGLSCRPSGTEPGPEPGVIEQQAERLIEPASLGITAYWGVTARGEVGKLNSTISKQQFLRYIGSYVDGFYTPDCGLDFWDHGAGAGELHRCAAAAAARSGPRRRGRDRDQSRPSWPRSAARDKTPTATILTDDKAPRRTEMGTYENTQPLT